jgi:murein DD-endopeptidase MepM/ murein hydrolase activator NlpD
MAAMSLWFSAGLLFAGGRRDSARSQDQAAVAAPTDAEGGEIPDTAGGAPTLAAGPDAEPETLAPETHVSEPPRVRFALIPGEPRPGEPVTIGIALPLSGENGQELPENTAFSAVLVNEQGQRLNRALFFTLPDSPPGTVLKTAVLAVPSTARPGKAFINVEPPLGGLGEISLIIAEREFAAEVIDLDERNTAIRTEPDPQKTAEAQQLWAILSRAGNSIYAAGAFAPPVQSTRRTSFFGDRRVYRYVNGSTDTSIHAGIDYGVPKGTPVLACAPGKVVLAKFRVVTGNSVIIEHLPAVYSLYYHMDSIAVTEGATIETGALLGESGATGLATGPHLHWEIRVAGENADPDAFIQRPILDKTAIINILTEKGESF